MSGAACEHKVIDGESGLIKYGPEQAQRCAAISPDGELCRLGLDHDGPHETALGVFVVERGDTGLLAEAADNGMGA